MHATPSGFVVAEDQRGFRVANVSAEELTDITEARIHIECEALRRSIEHADLDWEEKLVRAHLSRLPMLAEEAAGVDPEWEHAHMAFHSTLIGGCDSKWLVALAELLGGQTARYRNLPIASSSRPTKGKRADATRDLRVEHEQIVKATLARDAHRACALP